MCAKGLKKEKDRLVGQIRSMEQEDGESVLIRRREIEER